MSARHALPKVQQVRNWLQGILAEYRRHPWWTAGLVFLLFAGVGAAVTVYATRQQGPAQVVIIAPTASPRPARPHHATRPPGSSPAVIVPSATSAPYTYVPPATSAPYTYVPPPPPPGTPSSSLTPHLAPPSGTPPASISPSPSLSPGPASSSPSPTISPSLAHSPAERL